MSFQIYVGNYPSEFLREDVANLFKDFKGVKLKKWFKKEQKSFSFFTCEEIEEVVSVIEKMNNTQVSDRKLIVRASDAKLHKYVELILQEIKSDPSTLNAEDSPATTKSTEEISRAAVKNIKEKSHTTNKYIEEMSQAEKNKEISHNNSDSPPFVPMQVLRNKITHNRCQISPNDTWESNSPQSKSPSSYSSFSEHTYTPFHPRFSYKTAHKACQIRSNDSLETNSYYSKSSSSHSSFSEHSYKPSHRRFSNNSFSKQYDDDEKEYVWLSVINFPLNTPIRMIYELFDDYAPLKVLMICNYPRRDKNLTEAHVCFMNREVANDVIMNFDNTMFNGRLLLVNDIEDLTVMKELVNVVH